MVKGFIVAGTHSGCGKTTVSLGLLRALKNRKINVQPFKAGPDFIDTGLHRLACGKASVNLDLWSMDVEYWFFKYASKAEFNIVEGVMGLFDGEYSTFVLSKKLRLPIILVVDVYGMAESVSALIYGYKKMAEKEGLKIYIVLNRVSSENHLARLLKALKGKADVIGYLMKNREFQIPARHLGLFTAEEKPIGESELDSLACEIEKNFNIEMVLKLRTEAFFNKTNTSKINQSLLFPDVSKITIAYDQAFCFYYTHVIDSLKEQGVKISYISLLNETRLSEDIDLIWIGGGYPELYLSQLSENKAMRKEIKKWVDEGGKVYAECGGLIYLCKTMRTHEKTYEMANIFPFESFMNRVCLGYREVSLMEDSIIGTKGKVFRGHEFHYSAILDNGWKDKIYTVRDSHGKTWQEGYRYRNCLASYVHFICTNQRR